MIFSKRKLSRREIRTLFRLFYPEETKGFFDMLLLVESVYWNKANIGNPLNLDD
tara:strand:- start:251 stop:412 length:162 start_codon:yes stop_codon:yes gene_type:complete